MWQHITVTSTNFVPFLYSTKNSFTVYFFCRRALGLQLLARRPAEYTRGYLPIIVLIIENSEKAAKTQSCSNPKTTEARKHVCNCTLQRFSGTAIFRRCSTLIFMSVCNLFTLIWLSSLFSTFSVPPSDLVPNSDY